MRGNNVNRKHHVRALAGLAVMALVAASCGSDSDSSSDTDAPVETEAAVETTTADTEPADTEPADTEPADTEPADTTAPDAGEGFGALAPPTGEPILVGMVNTEGTPPTDFPEISAAARLAVDYLNEHGGMGGRPIEMEYCKTAPAPEVSQACAQELTGKGVELVMLGLDIFPAYDVYTATGTPVIGVLPLFPPDYAADALYLGGGNTTTNSAIVAFAEQNFGAKSVGIISADDVATNSSETSLIAVLEKAGISYVSIKGGNNETDAGYQGLVREAAAGNPDVLISLYSAAGCIGTMRARASLGIEIPAITTPLCAGIEVLDVVGEDAAGWYFAGIGTPAETTAEADMATVMEGLNGQTGGIGPLGITGLMTIASVANTVAAEGGDVTGASIYERLGTSTDLVDFPDGRPLTCGAASQIPSVCSFIFPVSEYVGDGLIQTVPGFEALDTLSYVP